ncbi:disintegrin and metalloproteinase domain-containing protein 10-like [Amblyomma americanum]
MADQGERRAASKAFKKKSVLPAGIVLVLFFSRGGDADELSPFIGNYELLSYPAQQPSNESARRAKRTSGQWHDAARVRFKALGRDFNLVLHPDLSAFSDDFVVTTSAGAVDVDLSHMYSGHVEADPGSRVFGSLVNGVFQGRISTGDGRSFYAEPAWMYPAVSESGHSVFYAAEDVRFPPQLGKHGGCGFDRLQAHLHAQNVDLGAHTSSQHAHHTPQKEMLRRKRRSPDIADTPGTGTRKPHARRGQGRRGRPRQDATQRLCHLQVVVDHTLYGFFAQGTDDHTARERITSLVGTHITSTNVIYTGTDFNGIVGMRFAIQDLKINDTHVCEGRDAVSNPFCRQDLDANLMLHMFAAENRNDFCLSYAWTNRDLGEGTLGLAYLAYPNEKLGGACEKMRSVNTRDGIRRMALNTGVVTFHLHGGPVALAVSEVTVAHEIGHSFGALHDETRACAPGGATGNYIMYARATTGLMPFNRRFSSCSIQSIGAVLHTILNSLYDKSMCFLSHQESFCGNNVREESEDCDCGYKERDCHDQCCFARKNSEGARGCTLRPNAQCSPSAGSCCTADCRYVSANHRCSPENDCNQASYCRYPLHVARSLWTLRYGTAERDWSTPSSNPGQHKCLDGNLFTGVAAQCPEPPHKPNLTECNHGTQVCQSGRCEGSVCQKYGYDDCQRVNTGSRTSPLEMCLVDCKRAGVDGPCLDTCKESALAPLCNRRRERGAACDQFRGYCDVFRRCRTVDEGGPLARLEQLFVPNRLRDWIRRYTWLVALLCVAFLGGVLLFIRCCAVLTPTNNPRLPKAKTFKESVQNPMELLRAASV